MVLPVPGAGRPGLLSFRVFGFPVTIHASFLVVVLLLGSMAGAGLEGALVWLVVVTVSVIAHELGHAAVAAPAGGNPAIDLYGMAGLTRWDARRAGRGRQVAVSIAGPGAGLAFGILLALLKAALDPPARTLLDDALTAAVYANVFWGALNLLPMLPLDGGQILRALMPGDQAARLRRASYVSLGVAVAVAVVAMAYGQPIAAAVVVFFAAGNLQTLNALRRSKAEEPYATRLRVAEHRIENGDPAGALALLGDAPPPALAEAAAVLRAMALVRVGEARQAQHLLLQLPPGTSLDETFAATVLFANGQEQLAYQQLGASLPNAPAWAVRELVALLLARGLDPDPVLRAAGPHGAGGAVTAFRRAGRYEDAARWGEAVLDAGAGDPAVAYHTAAALARLGQPERAREFLDRAVALGWDDTAAVDADPDLAGVRDLPRDG